MKELIKEARGISGIYFRFLNPETNKWENRVFEDLPESKQDELLEGRDTVWVRSLAKQLAKTLYNVAEQLDLTTINY